MEFLTNTEHMTNNQDIVTDTLVTNPTQPARLLDSLDANAAETWFITAGQQRRDKAPDFINQILIAQLS